MSRLFILGAGGHGRVVADAAELAQHWLDIVFLDDRFPGLSSSGHWRVIGTIGDVAKHVDEDDEVVVAIGHAETRLRLQEQLESAGCRMATVVHPRAVLSRSCQIGPGSVVFAGACINIGAVAGRAVIVNTGATVDHDCQLGDGVHVCPGANVAGEVAIGRGSWIGIGAAVRQCLTIGENVTVGAGAAVVANIPPGVTVVGVPARPVK